jgi:hypothetical protein
LTDAAALADTASPADAEARAPGNTALPRPVSQFLRTTMLAAPR